MTTNGIKTTTAQGITASPSPLLSDDNNHHTNKPVRPYARLVLTVEPDCFILAPYAPSLSHDSPPEAPGPSELTLSDTDVTKAIRVKYRIAPDLPPFTPETEIGESNQENRQSDGSEALSRVSFLPGSYMRSSAARDYIVYGCIGLLDLYSGPHLIVITTVNPLGEIEDKPVFAIDKVAVLPMDASEASHILDRLALFLDPSAKNPPEIAVKLVEEELAPEPSESREDPPVAKSPKIKFSFMGIKQEKEVHKSASTPSLPSLVSSNDLSGNPSSAKKISFEIPAFHLGRSSTDLTASKDTPGAVSAPLLPVAPLSPTRSTSPGFFAKLKESMSDKKISKSSLEIDTVSQPSGATNHPNAIEAKKGPGSQLAPYPEAVSTITDEGLEPPKSPLDTAEEFMANATKQLTNWSEGVLKSSTSFHLAKPDSGSGSIENLANETVTDGVSEEEQEKNKALDRRIIREICSLFGTGFYFSIEFNLLCSMQKRSEMSADGVSASRKHAQIVPLWKQVDPRFWWNENLLKEFLEIEANGFILPVMQGYVETEPCEIEEQAFEFTLISRRSKERSGLRYQRRGINEQGNTANFVETEQLLRIVRDDSDHQVSFVQTRGSIPLFWSQSPYRLKPIPIMERTEQENVEGFKKHVDTMVNTYGRQIFISLVEKHGRELVAGSAYTRYVEKLAEPNVRYVEFDFHEQCKGMKYENIDQLIKSLEVPIHELGYCWLAPRDADTQNKNSEHFQRLYDQKGVIRTNCMDCLDRTNVVQSAIGRHILNHQLLRLGIASFPDKGLSVYEDFENVFNNVWANNGDAISREYAGTSALKGDFTRTGKRNLQGMMNDATNSIARMYQNTFKDYFRQAAIDYLLGETDVNVFKNLQTTPFGTVVVPPPVLPPPPTPSQEPAQSDADEKDEHGSEGVSSALLPSLISKSSSVMSVSTITDQKSSIFSHTIGSEEEEKAIQQETWVRIRENAIETAAEIVISPGEERWKGWTFVCCSNEISSALTSASSPHASPQSTPTKKKSKQPKVALFKDEHEKIRHGEGDQAMFYDEKIVLLTERALYICTYDYEMEKVLEFWRLALEKIMGIDKGAFFLTSLDKTSQGQNPLENAGFAVVYRANSEGETLRVNSGSVRNRRMMGSARPNYDSELEKVQELDEVESIQGLERQSTVFEVEDGDQYSLTAKHLLRDEQKDIRSVRFKIVKHPEISVVPYMTSSEVGAADRSKANPVGYRRSAQDCVEWVVTEIVQARCELISVAEKSIIETRTPLTEGFETPPGRARENVTGSSRHGRSPSEEYNYRSPKDHRRSSVQVDLVIRDRVLQSLETAAQLEGLPVAPSGDDKDKKRSRKTFSRLFSSRDKMADGATTPTSSSSDKLSASKASNRSWLTKARKFQFGQDTDDESDDAKQSTVVSPTLVDQHIVMSAANDAPAVLAVESTIEEEGFEHGQRNEPRGSDPAVRPSNSNVFAKIRQAVKNL